MAKEPKVLWIEDNDSWLELRVTEITEDLAEHEIDFDHYPLETGEFLEDNFQYYPDFNIAVVDYGLNGLNGIEVIKRILKYKQNCRIILYSFDESIDLRLSLMNQLSIEERLLPIYSFCTKNELREVLVELCKMI